MEETALSKPGINTKMADSSPVAVVADGGPDKLTFNSVLLSGKEGQALRFFMRPSKTKARLKPLIEERGGFVSSRLDRGTDWIKVAAEGEKIASDDYIKYQYIEDCIAADKLLPLDDYRYVSQQDPKPSSSTDTIVSNVTAKGRSKYNSTEDESILAYIASHPKHSYSGNKIWKEMESFKVTSHTWQSMKHRFLNKLVDELPKYMETREEGRAKAASATASESEESSTDMGEATREPSPSCPRTDPSERNERLSGGYSGDSEPSQTGQHEESTTSEDQDVSQDSSDDFDAQLLEKAERLSSRKTRGRQLIPGGTNTKEGRDDSSIDTDTSSSMILIDSRPEMDWLSEKDREKEQTAEDVVRFVRSMQGRYDVSAKRVVQLLYIHSGCYEDVAEHLETGENPADHPPWTGEDDQKLNSSDPGVIRGLCRKYGEEAVMNRQEYFR